MAASSIQCRMLCACNVAYTIVPGQTWSPPAPTDPNYAYYEAVGWTDTPVAITGGTDQTDACVVGTNQDGTIVGFRGTLAPFPLSWASLYDWLVNDLLIEPTPVPAFGTGVEVHSGWWDSVNQIWSDLEQTLGGLDTTNLFFTGHSKGGPMATLAAMKHYTANQQAPTNYTYASPLPGNGAFAAVCDSAGISQTRYENYLDIVPFLPPPPWLIDLIESQYPHMNAWLKAFLDMDKGWDYVPVGDGFYIDESHTVTPMEAFSSQPTLLTDLRLASIESKIAADDFSAIAAAHCHSCAASDCQGGYMDGCCPGEVCTGG